MYSNLNGKVAVITGGGGVLGGAFAQELARHGVKVAVLDLRLNAAKSVVDKIRSKGGEAIEVVCGISLPKYRRIFFTKKTTPKVLTQTVAKMT